MTAVEDTLGLVGATVAEKYQVIEAVGHGGFAVVYLATHILWKRNVALKVFKVGDTSPAGQKALTDDLVREASLLAQLSEKTASICQARDLGVLVTPKGESLPYMVLEWLEGHSLGQRLNDERNAGLPPRSPAATVELLEPVAEALAVAHSSGIAHRDVKPGNVFLGLEAQAARSSVKLLDFGIAKVVQDAQKTGGAFYKTAGVVTAFTPNYGAPEQFSRRYGATGPWSDVFAFAIVMVEVMSGKRVIVGEDFVQMANVVIDPARRPTPRAMGVTVSDATEAVFACALAVQPLDRFQTAGAFWVALCRSLGVEPSRPILLAAEAALQDPIMSLASIPGVPSQLPPGALSMNPRPAASAPRATNQVLGTAATYPAVPVKAVTNPRGPNRSGKAVVAFGTASIALVFLGLALGYRHVRGTSLPGPLASASSTPVAASAPAPVASAPPPPCAPGMVLVKGGEFFMGSDDDSPAEKPAHHVEIGPYCMDIQEVTVVKYAACSDTGRCKRAARVNEWPGITEAEHTAYDPVCNARDPQSKAQHPINCVDWEMADSYCRSEPGRRLPTEAEWEFAARGSDGRKFPWGDETPSAAHLNACGIECTAWAKANKVTLDAMYKSDDGFATTAPVGSFPQGKSKFGILDLAGNVWEWVADWQAPYTNESAKNPSGPPSGKTKVIRGGAWNGASPAWVRPTFRFSNGPDVRSHGIGFRCAASPR
jgi:eukaryotic-like serine/threonine-protein kinase